MFFQKKPANRNNMTEVIASGRLLLFLCLTNTLKRCYNKVSYLLRCCMWNMLLNVVSNVVSGSDKPIATVEPTFSIDEFILGIIIGTIGTLLITLCIFSTIKECRKTKKKNKDFESDQ